MNKNLKNIMVFYLALSAKNFCFNWFLKYILRIAATDSVY